MATAQDHLVNGLQGLLNSGDYSDLTVKFGDQEWKEGISHVIELKEDDPALLRELLIACYTCSYDDTVSGDNRLDFNASMYGVADKYDIPFLKALSKGKLQAQLDGPMDIPRFLKAVRTIYTTTLSSDRGLRDLLLPVLKQHWSALNKNSGFLDLIKSGLADGDFVGDAIAAMSQLLDPKPKFDYFCRECGGGTGPSASQIIYCKDCEECMGGAHRPDV